MSLRVSEEGSKKRKGVGNESTLVSMFQKMQAANELHTILHSTRETNKARDDTEKAIDCDGVVRVETKKRIAGQL